MNHLMHLYLSDGTPQSLAGNLMGDFVKGRLDERFPPAIRRGIALHRRVDSLAQVSRHHAASRRRIDSSFGHYRGILVDLFYDHFLAVRWERYSSIPLDRYLVEARGRIESCREFLPERLSSILEPLFEEWLPGYGTTEGIGWTLARMSMRLSRPNPLAAGVRELEAHYVALGDDFTLFMEEIVEEVRRWEEGYQGDERPSP